MDGTESIVIVIHSFFCETIKQSFAHEWIVAGRTRIDRFRRFDSIGLDSIRCYNEIQRTTKSRGKQATRYVMQCNVPYHAILHYTHHARLLQSPRRCAETERSLPWHRFTKCLAKSIASLQGVLPDAMGFFLTVVERVLLVACFDSKSFQQFQPNKSTTQCMKSNTARIKWNEFKSITHPDFLYIPYSRCTNEAMKQSIHQSSPRRVLFVPYVRYGWIATVFSVRIASHRVPNY